MRRKLGNIKRMAFILLAASMMVTLTGCGKKAAKTTNEETVAKVEETNNSNSSSNGDKVASNDTQASTEASTEAPTEVPTEAPTEAPAPTEPPYVEPATEEPTEPPYVEPATEAPTEEPTEAPAPVEPSEGELYPLLWEGQDMQSRKAHALYDLYNVGDYTINGVEYYGFYFCPAIDGPDLKNEIDCYGMIVNTDWFKYSPITFKTTRFDDYGFDVCFTGVPKSEIVYPEKNINAH